MRHLTYLLLPLFAAGISFSQVQHQTGKMISGKIPMEKGSPKRSGEHIRNKAVVWTDDFSNPGTWTVSNSSSSGNNWVIGTNGPSGSFPIDPIASTTAANGFGLFDSDFYCSGDQHAFLRSVTDFNFTGQNSVSISFEQFYRKYTDQVFVEVSNDGGFNWVPYQVNAAFTQNQMTTNPQLVNIDISATAANANNVNIRFTFMSNAANSGEGCDYAWMVDDVSISTSSSSTNDLAVLTGYMGDVENAFDYSIVANSQRRPLVVGAEIQNMGASAIDNKTLSVVINDGTSNVYTGSTTFSLAGSATDHIWITTNYTPLNNKNYTLTFTVPSDDNNSNNTANASFSTMNYTYAHDHAGTETAGFNIDDEHSLGTTYQIFSNTTLYGVDVEFATGTTANQLVYVSVYSINSSIQDMDYIESKAYTIEASVIGTGNFTTIYFDSPISLSAGTSYVVDIFKQVGTSRLILGGSTTGDDDMATACYGPFGAGGAINFYSGWGKAIALRMNLNPGCISYNATSVVSDAQSCNANSGMITLDINTQGQTVANQNTISWIGPENGSSPANQSNDYSISGLIAGTYDVIITNNGCEYILNDIVIGSVPSPTLSATVVTPVSCFGSDDGSVSYSISGNSAGYSFTWEDGTSEQTRNNLSAGTYTITANNGFCTLTETITLTEPQEIGISFTKQNVTSCGGTNGEINITASGGTSSSYLYTWTGPSTGNSGPGFGNSFSINNLSAGNYTVTVTNESCMNSVVVSISESGAPAVNISIFEGISCPGELDAILKVNSTGNINGYTFTWSTGTVGTTLSNIGAGTYGITGTNGTCTTTANLELTEPAPIVITGSPAVSAINTTITGGTGSLSFSWTGPNGFTANTQNLADLTAIGTYTLTVTDQNGCTETRSFELGFVGMEEIAATAVISCYPNPASGSLTFGLDEMAKIIQIMDYTGKLVLEIAVKNKSEIISLEHYPSGIYLYKVFDAQNRMIHTDKVVILK